jgi:hypothetical protein
MCHLQVSKLVSVQPTNSKQQRRCHGAK